MKCPLGIVAILYAAGLLLGNFLRLPVPVLFGVSSALCVAAFVLAKIRDFLVWPLIIFTGWTNFAWRAAIISPDDLRVVITRPAEDVVVRGILDATPTERIYIRDEVESSRTLAQLSVSAICRDGQWHRAYGKLLVSTPGTAPKNCFSGQQVEISGIIAPPKRALAEGLFDYQTYLRRRGIYFQLKAESFSDWKILSTNNVPPWSDRFLAWAKSTLAYGLPVEDKPLRLMWAMTLGSKNVLPGEAYDPFIESGTMHIFAISGLHIALIAGILVSLLRVLRVSRMWCGVLVIPLIWFYTAATGWQSSAIRSAVMMSVIIGGWSLKRPTDLLNSLAAAALIILMWDPQQLFQAGFQLSFFVVLSIALILPPLEKILNRRLQPDPLLPLELIPFWKRCLHWSLRFFAMCLATSFAAWLGSWPLTAFYFHLFSPVTLLANLLIVPLSGFALACNLGALICGTWLPMMTELFNFSGWFWMNWMDKISEFTTQIPGAFVYVPAPAIADFAIYYSMLIAALTGFAFAAKRRKALVFALTLVCGFYFWRWNSARQSTDITVLPLSGGSAVYCDAPGAKTDWLIDCGDSNSVEFVTAPFLHAQGVNRLHRLALTHGDARQIGGAGALQEIFPIEKIATSSASFRSHVYRLLIKSLRKTPERWRKLNSGDAEDCWTVLHPASGADFAKADNKALVLRGEINGFRVLLLSDLGWPGQDALLNCYTDLRADIVVSGLPNENEPLCDALLRAIQPKLIVVADPEFAGGKRAGAPLRKRLKKFGVPVLYTRDSGAVTISLRRKNWIARAMDGSRIESRSAN
ncbi:MAG TPA: ComEC/Rec2 family competence protein [Verrucomicrobiae bacterium]|nr:ComEC/Rec2 family competence protein [Verrucomicrobiae bacterium]